MLNLLVSPQAFLDLEEIFEYTIRTWSYAQAEKYQDELYTGMIKISHDPDSGNKYFFKAGNYRYLKINRHLIFYKTTAQDCLIIRVLHEVMDINAHLM